MSDFPALLSKHLATYGPLCPVPEAYESSESTGCPTSACHRDRPPDGRGVDRGAAESMTPQQEFAKALDDHLSTWGPNCGAPYEVYEGHLQALLRAHRKAVLAEAKPPHNKG